MDVEGREVLVLGVDVVVDGRTFVVFVEGDSTRVVGRLVEVRVSGETLRVTARPSLGFVLIAGRASPVFVRATLGSRCAGM